MKKLLFLLLMFIVFINKVGAITMAPVDIRYMSINELISAMQNRIISCEQLVTLYLERIEAYNDTYNAVLEINKNAIEEARLIDEKIRNNNSIGRLAGIPIIVKTNIDAVGLATTAGSKALNDNYPNVDSDVVTKLKAEGAIIIASANMSEFAFMARNSYSSYGHVRNAFNSSYTSYGSSGGSAVAVALSFAAASLGTDTNSSIRVPASAANLVGFRTTYGLIEMDGIIPYDTTRDTVGPLTKTVSDNALILSVLTEIDYVNVLDDSSLEGVVIGVPRELYEGSNNTSIGLNKKTYHEIYEMMSKKIEYLEEQGAIIVYIDKFITSYYYNIASTTMAGITFCDGFNNYISNHDSKIKSFKQLAYNSSSLSGYLGSCNLSSSILENKWKKKDSYKSYIDGIYEDYNLDVIIYPTTKNKVLKLNATGLISTGNSLPSVIGYPSVSVPLGIGVENLSYGIEFLAKENEESKLYQIIYAYEKSNELKVTEDAPSLYNISDSVVNLVNKYYWLLEIDCATKDDLIDEIKLYFATYNEIEDIDIKAQILNEKIENLICEVKIESSEILENENVLEMILICIVLLLTIMCLFLWTFGRSVIVLRKRKKVINQPIH